MDCVHLRALMWTPGVFFHWLPARINHRNMVFQKSCPCLGWLGHIGPVLHFPEAISPKDPGPRVHKATGLRIWGPEVRASSVSDELCDLEQIIHLFGSHFFSSTKVKYLFWTVSTIPSCTASLYNLTLFWNPRILLKWFHMNSIIMSANPLKYIFEILYIHCYHCLEKNITCIEGHKDTYFSFFGLSLTIKLNTLGIY